MAGRAKKQAKRRRVGARGTKRHLTLGQIKSIPYGVWEGMKTIESGHFDNLKYQSPTFRVWVSRATLADYDGDRAAYARDRFTVEKNVNGRWERAYP